MTGSALYHRMLAFDHANARTNELMREVWSGTPWMVDAWTGSPAGDEWREITDWCRARWGREAWPIHGRPGDWHTGGVTLFGWTWLGFRTEAQLRAFMARWRCRDPETPR